MSYKSRKFEKSASSTKNRSYSRSYYNSESKSTENLDILSDRKFEPITEQKRFGREDFMSKPFRSLKEDKEKSKSVNDLLYGKRSDVKETINFFKKVGNVWMIILLHTHFDN